MLSKSFIREGREPGKHRDDANLYLVIPPTRPDAGTWQFRYSIGGRARVMGLGPRHRNAVEVRSAASAARALLERGTDPLRARDAEREAAERERAQQTTFSTAAAAFIGAHRAGWRSAVHLQQWENTLATYAAPVIGEVPVSEVSTEQVLAILQPIWTSKPETANRLRGRIEQILDFARARGWRSGENPAVWRGHLRLMLPAKRRVITIKHLAALDWREVPAFWAELGRVPGIAALALAFAIVTAARAGEVRSARWDEIDLGKAVWTIPAEKMKGGRAHRVPLSAPALAILARLEPMRAAGGMVFPGRDSEHPLCSDTFCKTLRRMGRRDITGHGFRSTFRDWAAETTAHPNHVVEQALAHINADRVEAAYRRGDLFEKRRVLMADWAAYLTKPAAEVVPLRGLKAAAE